MQPLESNCPCAFHNGKSEELWVPDLEADAQTAKNHVERLRNSKMGAYVYQWLPANLRIGATSRWRGARRRCCSTVPHMADSTDKGPEPRKGYVVLHDHSSSFHGQSQANGPCSTDGYVIGDGETLCLDMEQMGGETIEARRGVPRRSLELPV